MKILLKLCMMLLMLVGFGAAYAAQNETTSTTTYTVVKGDTLSAIAKKFPGTTWQTLARTNNIAKSDLIYPNTVLKITQANTVNFAKETQNVKAKPSHTPRTSSIKTKQHEAMCDMEYGLDQLKYPDTVRSAFISANSKQDEAATSLRERTYSVNEGGNEFVFQISKNCVYTKIVQTNEIPPVSREEQSDRSRVGVSSLLQPENTPGYAQDEEFRSIKHALEEVLPNQDVTRLAVAVLRQRQHRREMPRSDLDQKLVSKRNDQVANLP